MVNILSFVSITTKLSLCSREVAISSMSMNDGGCVPVKVHLQTQTGPNWALGCSSATPS